MWYVMSVDISVFGHLCCVFLCVTVMASIMGVYMYVCYIEFVCLLVRYCENHVQFQHYDLYLHTTILGY